MPILAGGQPLLPLAELRVCILDLACQIHGSGRGKSVNPCIMHGSLDLATGSSHTACQIHGSGMANPWTQTYNFYSAPEMHPPVFLGALAVGVKENPNVIAVIRQALHSRVP